MAIIGRNAMKSPPKGAEAAAGALCACASAIMRSISTSCPPKLGNPAGTPRWALAWHSIRQRNVEPGCAVPGREPGKCSRLFYHAGAVAPELQRPRIQRLRPDCLAQFAGEAKVVVEIVDRVEARAQDLVHFLQMMEIGAGEVRAGVAIARLVERAGVAAMFRVAYPHVAMA